MADDAHIARWLQQADEPLEYWPDAPPAPTRRDCWLAGHVPHALGWDLAALGSERPVFCVPPSYGRWFRHTPRLSWEIVGRDGPLEASEPVAFCTTAYPAAVCGCGQYVLRWEGGPR